MLARLMERLERRPPASAEAPLVFGLADGPVRAERTRQGTLVGAVALPGRRLWLEAPSAAAAVVERYSRWLCGPAVQLVLSRRGRGLAACHTGWERALAGANLDEATRTALGRDYIERALSLVGDLGLADVTAALWLSAPDAVTLSERLAGVSEWAPAARPLAQGEPGALTQLRPGEAVQAAAAFSFGEADYDVDAERVLTAAGPAVRLWRLAGLPPLIELGWVRHLLAEAGAAAVDFDLVWRLQPVADAAAVARLAQRELAAVEAQLGDEVARGRPPASLTSRLLAAQRRELKARLAAVEWSPAAVLEVSGHLLISEPLEPVADLAARQARLVAVLQRLGCEPQPVRGPAALRRAWRAIAPRSLGERCGEGDYLLPAGRAAALTWLAVTPGQAGRARPVLDITAEGVAWAGLAERRRPEHVLLTGDEDSGLRAAVGGWALGAALNGAAVVALGHDQRWAALGHRVGGQVLAYGPGGQLGADVLAASEFDLQAIDDWTTWHELCAGLVRQLLGSVDEEQLGAVRAACLELGLARLERGEQPSLAGLIERLRGGGWGSLAAALTAAVTQGDQWVRGPWPLDRLLQPGLSTIGWAGPGTMADWWWVAALTLRRLVRLRQAAAGRRRAPLVVIVDVAGLPPGERALTDGLLEAVRRGLELDLRLWLVGADLSQWPRTAGSREVWTNCTARASFRQAAAEEFELVEWLGWSRAVAKEIPRLEDGWALVRIGGEPALVHSVAAALLPDEAALAAEAERAEPVRPARRPVGMEDGDV